MTSRAGPWAPTRIMASPTLSPVAAGRLHSVCLAECHEPPLEDRRAHDRHPGRRRTIKCKRIEKPFVWIKTISRLKIQYCGRGLVEWLCVCSPTLLAISFTFRRCWQQRDESVWSVKHETKRQRKPRVQGPLRHRLAYSRRTHEERALQEPFFGSLLMSLPQSTTTVGH